MTVDPEYADLLRQYHQAPTPELAQLLHDRYMHLRGIGLFGGTTTSGLPYPDPSDPVAGGADAIRALAEELEPRVPVGIVVGWISFPSVAPNAKSSVEVTFPVGMFAERPSIVITAASGAPEARPMSVSGGSATGFTGVYTNLATAASGVGAYWIAVQSAITAVALLNEPVFDATVTCTQDGCFNAGKVLPAYTTWLDDDGKPQPITAFQCGACGATLIPEGA